MLSGLCIRFEWWLFLFSTCQPPGQLPTAREGTAWPGVLMYVCASRDECVCVCVCVCVQVHMSMLRVGAGPAEKNL